MALPAAAQRPSRCTQLLDLTDELLERVLAQAARLEHHSNVDPNPPMRWARHTIPLVCKRWDALQARSRALWSYLDLEECAMREVCIPHLMRWVLQRRDIIQHLNVGVTSSLGHLSTASAILGLLCPTLTTLVLRDYDTWPGDAMPSGLIRQSACQLLAPLAGCSRLRQLELLAVFTGWPEYKRSDYNKALLCLSPLGHLTALQDLNLFINSDRVGPPSGLTALSSLTSLDLNLLSEDAVELLPKQGNYTLWAPAIRQLCQLRRLAVSCCSRGDDFVSTLHSLIELSLEQYHASALPLGIAALSKLQDLYITDACFAAPSSLQPLSAPTRLQSLALLDCAVCSLPACIGRLALLTNLELASCNLRATPPQLAQLPSLERLDLSCSSKLRLDCTVLAQLQRLTWLGVDQRVMESTSADDWSRVQAARPTLALEVHCN